jgi:tRNA threonylcarbamoyladenosine biosynthesis protein TsaB
VNTLVAGLDCTGETYSVALMRGADCLAESGGTSARAHLRLLFPALTECASRAGVRLADLDRVAVTAGPGSFTGLRLGIVTARTMAQVLGCRVVPVDTLEALAWNVPDSPRVVAALDARRGEIFAACFETRAGECLRLTEDRAFTPEELAGALESWGGGVLVGSAAARYGPVLSQVPGVRVLPPVFAQIRGSAVALAGRRADPVAALDLAPTYLRSAEVQLHGVQP